MADIEINRTILNILKEYYTVNVAYVKIGNRLSDAIEVTKSLTRGVRELWITDFNKVFFSIVLYQNST